MIYLEVHCVPAIRVSQCSQRPSPIDRIPRGGQRIRDPWVGKANRPGHYSGLPVVHSANIRSDSRKILIFDRPKNYLALEGWALKGYGRAPKG